MSEIESENPEEVKPKKKVDRRSITSKANFAKARKAKLEKLRLARLARARKLVNKEEIDQNTTVQEYTISESDSDYSSSDDSDSDDEPFLYIKKNRKRAPKEKQISLTKAKPKVDYEAQINQLTEMVQKLTASNKKTKGKQKKPRTRKQTIVKIVNGQTPKKKPPAKAQSLKNQILQFD